MKLAFVDTETTGLSASQHQAYEFAWAIDDDPTRVMHPAHDLRGADPRALEVGRYFERGFRPHDRPFTALWSEALHDLRGATLVGSNPAFDQEFMERRIFGVKVWKHRMVNVAEGAKWVFGWHEPRGLADVVDECRDRGYAIPAPDHTAEADVAATRAVYHALTDLRGRMTSGPDRG